MSRRCESFKCQSINIWNSRGWLKPLCFYLCTWCCYRRGQVMAILNLRLRHTSLTLTVQEKLFRGSRVLSIMFSNLSNISSWTISSTFLRKTSVKSQLCVSAHSVSNCSFNRWLHTKHHLYHTLNSSCNGFLPKWGTKAPFSTSQVNLFLVGTPLF